MERGDIVSGNVGEVGLHGGVTGRGVRAEPGGVAGGRGGVRGEVTRKGVELVLKFTEYLLGSITLTKQRSGRRCERW